VPHRRAAIASFLTIIVVSLLMAAAPPADEWKSVKDSMDKGLPKTAIEKLQPIITRAMSEEAYPEAIKAIALKMSLEGSIEGNKPEEKIRRLEVEIAKAPAGMKPPMQAVLANWYWHYFQQNRWRFLQRTQTDAPPSDDFTTWDLTRILAEIDKHFQLSLTDADALKNIAIADYAELLEKGNAPDTYRPTLYDFLAYEALDFYAAGEQVATLAQNAYELSADSPIFAGNEEFLAWVPDSTDQASVTLKAVKLYQKLIAFHQDDDDTSARLDAELLRLNFGNNRAVGEEKPARYKAALRRFSEAHSDHPISARALHHLANAIHGESDWAEARQIAQVGLNRFPDSVGGRRCFNLVQQIEARSSRVSTERVWNKPTPTIDVVYRNVNKIHFRLVEFNFEDLLRASRWQPEQLDRNWRIALLRRRSVHSWSEDLPATEDFQQRREQLPAPTDLPAGSYCLIASHNPRFDDTDNQVSFCEVWISDLSIVTRSRRGTFLVEGFVLDAVTGDPIAGARVRAWNRSRGRQFIAMNPTRTDQNGMFRFRGSQPIQVVIHAAHNGQSLSSSNLLQTYNEPNRVRVVQQTRFFTDRALYRPGQTIRYKGICVSFDQQKDDYKTIPNRDVTVILSDVNGKEVERVRHRTGDYGSFSGSVTAPRDRLAGVMTLRVEGDPAGQTQISVEEYKRPKFRVELDSPQTAAKLGGNVTVQGTATAYTGVAINDASVSWRVVREVRYPIWWYWRCWWMPPGGGDSQEIAHGTSLTTADGTFDIKFVAKPDASVPEQSEPTFRYTVYADVTDTTGETRSDQIGVNVGYTALSAQMTASDWLTDNEVVDVSIRTTTLDGQPQPAQGTIKIHSLKQPAEVARAPLAGPYYGWNAIGAPPAPDPANPNSWETDEVVFESQFETNPGGSAKVSTELAAGIYRAMLETTDQFGKSVTAVLPMQVLDPEANRLNLKLPNLVASPGWSVQPGDEFMAVWGSGYDSARAFVEVEHRGKLLQSFWTKPGTTQIAIKQTINESMRGGLTLRTTMVRENRAYLHSQQVSVPWTNKDLSLKWEHFVSKLKPAQQETWTAVIQGPDAQARVAEMVATLYDASLDAYRPHHWQRGFNVFRQDHSRIHSKFENQAKNFHSIYQSWRIASRDGSLTYRHFPGSITQNHYGYQFFQRGRGMAVRAAMESAPSSAMEMSMDSAVMGMAFGDAPSDAVAASLEQAVDAAASPGPDLSKVSARKNLNETAFFFPHLISDEDGVVKLQFSMPEALTEWTFLGFAHDRQLRGGLLSGSTVTAKDLMVEPNPPRFLREGDEVEFTVKVSNQSPTRLAGTVRLAFADARTGDDADEQLGNVDRDLHFDIPSGESKSLAWRLKVPDGMGFLTYKAVASTGRLSDGEEGFLPVLSRRILVTESISLPIRGKQVKELEFERLRQSASSDSLQSKTLTVQMVSNPSWYAVMALPYLMEYPHQCSEQTFNRLYANCIARHIAQSDPKIHRVFEQWRGTPALDSPLEKNDDLKAVMLEETPWLRQAEGESQARRNVGILFDDNRLNSETERVLQKLSQDQLSSGAWSWFPGGRANDYITLYITTGFGRLRHLGVDIDPSAAIKSLSHLDEWSDRMYRRIKPADRHKNHLSSTIAFYLYGRSFFSKDQPVSPEHTEAMNYWIGQAKKHWLALANRQSQAHLAISLKRLGEPTIAKAIMNSIKERSVSDEELGMFWRDTERSWWWYRAPIETQAMMIEAFDEVMNDTTAVEDCKVWLLKQKQTQDWKTTKATADAVYALLLRGSDVLASDALVEVSLGGEVVRATAAEAGTGFYEQRFVDAEIKPSQGEIKLTKVDDGVAWGSVHWQYLEDMSKVTPYEGTPLKLTKQLYIKRNTDEGKKLVAVDGPIGVGDELVVRIVLRTDRDMEYVHLKDYRGSGTEPVNVLSRYKYQDGLAYYESTRDTASHFFIDYLPKGTYVFEYSTRVQMRGKYQTGVASIQCMYAPEFNSHSESLNLEVGVK
jgi:hypothetical protein